MAVQLLASELLSLDAPTNSTSDEANSEKSRKKHAIVYWIKTKEFNVMPLSRIPKDKREEGATATLKVGKKEWCTKVVKIGGEYNVPGNVTCIDIVHFSISCCSRKGGNC